MPEHGAAHKHLEQYKTFGFIGPVKAFDAQELVDLVPAILQELRHKGFSLAAVRNRHLDWDIAHRLVAAEAIAALAAQLLGPELVLWRTNFFTISAGKGLRWHQDEYRTLLADPLRQLSVHLGISEASEDNCLLLVPGSHAKTREELAEAGFHFIADTKGYGAPNFWREADKPVGMVRMMLKPGEFFIFHPRLLHASRDLISPQEETPPVPTSPLPPRVGFAIRLTVPDNEVLPAAFAETASRGDHCVRLPYRR